MKTDTDSPLTGKRMARAAPTDEHPKFRELTMSRTEIPSTGMPVPAELARAVLRELLALAASLLTPEAPALSPAASEVRSSADATATPLPPTVAAPPSKLLVTEVAELLRRTPETVRHYIRTGRLKAQRNPRCRTYLVDPSAVDAFLAAEPDRTEDRIEEKARAALARLNK
jgi:excisionase family DNA binding protein